jgi:hypothetical protein
VSTVKNFLVIAFFFSVLDGLAIVSIWWAIVSFAHGEYLTVVVVTGFAFAFLCLIASLVLIMRQKVSPSADVGDHGTTIRPDRVVGGLVMWGTAGAYLALATFAILAPLGKIAIPLPPGNRQYIIIVAVSGTIWGIVDVWRTFKRGGVSFVKLNTAGFDMSQGSSSVRGDWDDVVAVTDRRPGKPAPLRAMIFVKFRDERIRSLVVDSYTPGGEAMRRLVRYYWTNPDKRDELTDGAAIERLAEFVGTA